MSLTLEQVEQWRERLLVIFCGTSSTEQNDANRTAVNALCDLAAGALRKCDPAIHPTYGTMATAGTDRDKFIGGFKPWERIISRGQQAPVGEPGESPDLKRSKSGERQPAATAGPSSEPARAAESQDVKRYCVIGSALVETFSLSHPHKPEGDWVRSKDYDALAAKLAQAERARDEAEADNVAMKDRHALADRADDAEAKLAKAEARIAELERTERVLDSDDSYCPKCGHNRDKSSVSSIDLGDGVRQCQSCGATWHEYAQ